MAAKILLFIALLFWMLIPISSSNSDSDDFEAGDAKIIVQGYVICSTCSLTIDIAYALQGAEIGIICKSPFRDSDVVTAGFTDENGQFSMLLPGFIPRVYIKGCWAKLLGDPPVSCSINDSSEMARNASSSAERACTTIAFSFYPLPMRRSQDNPSTPSFFLPPLGSPFESSDPPQSAGPSSHFHDPKSGN